ncbi:alpha/beta hydrolase [Glycomyces luteolus]|uniref:Alpha/beta hydrolase n=1 Tax=Glycomyces luteolus TaxID=2670330 RepID=A0A9X3SPI7_9ACTN|nr:alpha/beta hydrolase [Glycomyces luteolus]MDA1358991.1 alpha/beta hydrolase [Glycomyces luteolus]
MADNESATFVLIHGGGSSGWDWHLVSPVLRELGHEVIAVDLPIEDKSTGVSEYADAVVEACGDRPNLVVVAHSWGGLVAPIVCSRIETELLVFVTAMVPLPGEAPNDWWDATGFSGLEPGDPEADAFYNGVPAELAEECNARGREQTGERDGEPSPLKAWPDVPTRFLLCRDDRFFPPEFMRGMVRDRLGITPDEIDGGHMIALARPRELAERLHRYWAELPR